MNLERHEDIIFLSRERYQDWDRFVLDFNRSTFYSSSEWVEFLISTFGVKNQSLLFIRDGEIIGGLLLFLVSNFFMGKKFISVPHGSIGGGVLCSEPRIERILIERALDLCKKYKAHFLEIRTQQLNSLLNELEFLQSQPFLTSHLDLIDEESNWRALSRGHKSSINKAKKNGLEITESKNQKVLKQFYHILQVVYRAFGTPIYGFKFFNNLCESLSDKGLVKFLIATYNQEVVGGVMLFCFNETIIYRLGAAKSKYNHLRPYNALLWHAIRLGCKNGFKHFNFGTSHKDDNGLLEFKRRFGADTKPVNFYYHVNRGKIPNFENYTSKYNLAIKVWKSLPLKFTEMGGAHIRKWIC